MSDERRLADLAAAVLRGTPVDWDAEESGAAENDRPAVSQMRVLAQIAALGEDDAAKTSGGREGRGPQRPLAPNTSWGHLTVIELVGEGAFAEVHRAWDTLLDREVALKLFPVAQPGAGEPPELAEARRLARIRHPNVVTVHGADQQDGRVGLWTEFVPGRTLEECLRDDGPFTAREATLVGLDLCRALSAVHGAGLLHRDVKAQNVMREDSGRVVLMDFGMVRPDAGPLEGPAETGGTPLYMAPELFEHRPATVATDVYALGVLIYHLVTGSYPISGRSVAELREAHASVRRGSLADVRPDLPADFTRVVERAIERDPAARIQSAAELEAALADALAEPADLPATRERVEAPENHSRRFGGFRRYGWVLAPVAIAVVAIGGSYIVNRRPPESQGPSVRGTVVAPTQPGVGSPGPPTAPASAALPSTPPPGAAALVPGPRWSLKPRDWVLIAAFENRTGQAQLDGTIEAALERELSASEFFRVAPPDRVQQAMRLMTRPATQVLDASVALEVSRRDGFIAALVTGDVKKVGGRFLLQARIVEVAGGSTVAAVAEEAASETDLMPAVRRISSRIRDRLGESRDRIAASTQTQEPVTTPSWQALRLFSASVGAAGNNNPNASLELARAAIEQDPAFASGHAWVAYLLLDQGKPEDAAAAIARATPLAATATEPEQLFIRAVALDIQDHQKEAAAAWEAYLRLRPDDVWAIKRLVVFYGNAGRSEDLVRASIRAADLRPRSFVANEAAAWYGMFYGGRLAEIQPYLARARALITPELNPDTTAWLRLEPAFEDWLRGDARSAADRLDRAATSEESGGPFLMTMAGLNIGLGRLRAAEAVLDRLPRGQASTSLILRAETAWWRRDDAAAQTAINALLKLPAATQPGLYRLAALMVRVGMVEEARSLVAGQPDNVKRASPVFPPADGEVALATGDVERAIERLAGWDKFARGIPSYVGAATTYAEALERHGDLRESARVLETLAASRVYLYQSKLTFAWWLSGRVQLARVYQALGRTAEARTVNAELRRLLACADPDFALLRAVNAR